MNALATRINAELDDVNTVIAQTKFNGTQLLDNNFTGRSYRAGADAGETVNVPLDADIDSAESGLICITRTFSATYFTDRIFSKVKELANTQELKPKQPVQIPHKRFTGVYEYEEVLNKVAEEILKDEDFQEA